jgi:HSP20 family protein
MAIMRWEPFREIESMQQQMNQLFDRMMSSTDGERKSSGISFMPAAEIQETDDEVKLHVEVPGIDVKDLDVKVSEDAVAITGERKSQINNEDKGIRRSEFRYGRFQRIIPLPASIQNDKVQADFQNGVLSLTLPKSESHKHKVVSISLPGQTNGQASQGQIPNGTTQGQMPNGMSQEQIPQHQTPQDQMSGQVPPTSTGQPSMS